jgi:hypothetical protein
MSNLTEQERRPDATGAADAVRAALRALPQRPPPADAWQRLSDRAADEGVLASPRARHALNTAAWRAAAALGAVALLLAVWPRHAPQPDAPRSTAAARSAPVTVAVAEDGIGPLIDRSRALERRLRALPAEPSVQRVGTAGTITALEDRVATIDAQLSLAAMEGGDGDAQLLWRERVSLMDTLVKLRSADAQRVWL